MDKLLGKLIDSFSVSGNEDYVKNIIKEELKTTNCELTEDKMGNLIASVGSGDSKIMLCAHMDSIGFIVSYIEDNGLIRVEKIGCFENEYAINSFVRFKNGTVGRLCNTHDQLFIDIGLDNKIKSSEKVKIGDTACLVGPYIKVGKGNIMSPLLDNKVGCYILIKLIERAVSVKDKKVFFVFSTEEELGGRGARAAAYGINPDYCIVLGLEKAKDMEKSDGNVELGKGPVLKIMDKSLIMHMDIKNMLEESAKKSGINVQYSISAGTSEGGLLHKERAGIKTGELDIPCRYKHSCSEMICIDDIEGTIKLLENII
ncbi:M42 family peptidase [Clostridium fermenticellae]|uniref:M42 family peptidase n=1 Tax=Clostridium fermenticellae TaxID=2068654 RepID=A0A386H097_9CLOT|nr:M42 family peptidase [Clostridium fermenticellae]AYD39091.1 M42 family peptidase [Clostridium fermenticellae]